MIEKVGGSSSSHRRASSPIERGNSLGPPPSMESP